MLTSKRRAYLRGQANRLNPIIQIGKDGISDGVIEQVDAALDDHELIKGRILNNSMEDVRDAANQLADKTEAEVVQTIGNVFVIFRRNNEEPKYILP
ncbi:ribosome assembly RNA-binding protein YhbY [Natronospora cellulosivora (SeqCode)]